MLDSPDPRDLLVHPDHQELQDSLDKAEAYLRLVRPVLLDLQDHLDRQEAMVMLDHPETMELPARMANTVLARNAVLLAVVSLVAEGLKLHPAVAEPKLAVREEGEQQREEEAEEQEHPTEGAHLGAWHCN